MSGLNRRRMLTGAAGALTATGIAAASGGSGAGRALAVETNASGQLFDSVKIGPDDLRYPELTRGMNQRWVSKPDHIRMVATTEQVVKAVQEAASANKRLTVQGGGHCYADFVHNPNVDVVINMSEMNNVYFDQGRSAFVVEAGATLMEVYESLFKIWGVTLPGGMCFSVGMGGHVPGGGYGLLSRKEGLIADHLYAVEVVTVDGSGNAKSVIATREADDPNRDLWWAHTGGGGGNFGVVTRYWFRSPGVTATDPGALLPRPPEELLVNAVSIPWSELDSASFTRLVKNYGTWFENNSAPGSAGASLSSFLLVNHKANGSAGLLTVVDGSDPNADSLLRDYLDSLFAGANVRTRPLNEPVGEMNAAPELYQPMRLPWLRATRLLGTNNPTLNDPTMRADYKSGYLKRSFTEKQIATMYEQLTRTDHANPNSIMVLLSYGGAINSVAPDATASAQRDSAFKVLVESFWSRKSEDSANVNWCRSIYNGIFAEKGGYPVPDDRTDGCYINYPDMDITDPEYNKSGVPWYKLYYKNNYPKLQRVKKKYDPTNFFRHSQSIKLPSA
ncbi:FAD-binding oxidoreductase [Actinopolyspora erythraea]|uniref:FAD-binding oxidoreductase n=1 Tax=Actinopolyspora erythraea TaxID=414996 RepID=A0A099CZK7_9ACTN|nr:FAD-binding oxidoreductase [Actinopolyspora erythraea]ASU79664.1 FAD-binding oxidoreductase [Actinopolyspora erythraea]KGI79408.1 FAD-linked oxidase [Actinopolyspora erythraea]